MVFNKNRIKQDLYAVFATVSTIYCCLLDKLCIVSYQQAVHVATQYAPSPLPWPMTLTFWPWQWCPSHMWHGLPLCQFWSS